MNLSAKFPQLLLLREPPLPVACTEKSFVPTLSAHEFASILRTRRLRRENRGQLNSNGGAETIRAA